MITSRDNPKLRLVRRLGSASQRRRLGLFVAEGEDLVEAAREANVEPVELLVAGESIAPGLLAEVSLLPHPPRVVGVYRRADLPRVHLPPLGLALWRVADPGNVGTLVRAADAFGAFVALSAGCADPVGPKALRASTGSIFRVPLVAFDDAPGRRVALLPRGGSLLADVAVEGPTLLVLGAERAGLPDEVLATCAERATIPHPGRVESLNVAMAGTIALYELARSS